MTVNSIKISNVGKNIIFCLRGLLIPIGLMAFIIFFQDQLSKGHGFGLVILSLIGLPIAIFLCLRQIWRDIKCFQMDYAHKLFTNLYNEGQSLNQIDNIDRNVESSIPEEYVWDTINNKAYGSFYSYMIDFRNRRDLNAIDMRRTFTKSGMKNVISNSLRRIHSIKYWEKDNLISIDSEEPFDINNIISFEIANNQTIQRGRAYTSGSSTHKTKSYNFLTDTYTYKTKTVLHTDYEPDKIINDYTLILTLRNSNQSCIQLPIGNNSTLAHELKSKLIYLTNRN